MSDVQVTSEPTSTAQAADGNQPLPPVSDAADRAELQQMLKAVREENAQRRRTEQEAKQRAEEAARASGDHKALAEMLQKKLAEIEPLIPKAQAYEQYEARKTQQIAEIRGQMPAHWQAMVDTAATLDAKRAIVNAYNVERASAQPQQPQRGAPIPVANPAGAPAIDFESVIASQSIAALDDAKRRDPEGLKRFLQSRNQVKQKTMIG